MVSCEHYKLVVTFPNPFDESKELRNELHLHTNVKEKLNFPVNETVYFLVTKSVVKLYIKKNEMWEKREEWRSFFKSDPLKIHSLDGRIKALTESLDNEELKKLLPNNNLFLSNYLSQKDSLEHALNKTCKLKQILIKN